MQRRPTDGHNYSRYSIRPDNKLEMTKGKHVQQKGRGLGFLRIVQEI
jgi:hypothetical protein